ncbi:MAG: response regulator [Gammaproteobacteria bacterium]|jgi:CheY-like chemotaxis protein|nr:response regulator [Gammaproteobacteria bacterium]
MEQKCALIVDDSRSARVVLRRLLEQHDLEVATAESAEQALEYLTEHRPDVIFMDHMMPGMDGFEAVRAIKDNPDTATIPIMMYTSQEGELYVGQARALGAVGVLPKQVAPVEVSKVLESLRLIESSAEAAPEAGTASMARSTGDTAADLQALSGLDTGLREMIQDLFEQQRSIIRRDLIDSYESIAARVAEEIGSRGDTADTEAVAGGGALPRVALAAVAVLTAAALAFGWLYLKAERQWQAERVRSEQLLEQLRNRQALVADGTVAIEERMSETRAGYASALDQALETVQWAVNQNGRYGWQELAFGEEQRLLLEELLDRLDAMGFTGRVQVVSHVGDFCLLESGGDDYAVAPADLPLTGCDRLGLSAEEAVARGSRQSVAFANFLGSVPARYEGRITVGTGTAGNAEPLLSYPPVTDALRAGEWNRVAAVNNRLRVEILPD